MNIAFYWFKIGLAVYIGLLGILYVMQRSLLYVPEKTRPSLVEYKAEELFKVVTVRTEDGLALEGWYHPPLTSDMPTIIWFHGNAQHHGARFHAAKGYAAAGYGVLLAGYRGYGGNPGSPSEAGLYKDGYAWLEALSSQLNTRPEQAVLYGESLGTGIAIEMATRVKVGAIVLQAPYTSMVDAAFYHYPYVPVRWLLKDRYDNMSKISRIQAPLLIFHGMKDTVIPIRLAAALYDAAPEPKKFTEIERAGHGDLY